MNHAGVEVLEDGRHLTACGIVTTAQRAPYSQPVSAITCKRCRASIMRTWRLAILERAR